MCCRRIHRQQGGADAKLDRPDTQVGLELRTEQIILSHFRTQFALVVCQTRFNYSKDAENLDSGRKADIGATIASGP